MIGNIPYHGPACTPASTTQSNKQMEVWELEQSHIYTFQLEWRRDANTYCIQIICIDMNLCVYLCSAAPRSDINNIYWNIKLACKIMATATVSHPYYLPHCQASYVYLPHKQLPQSVSIRQTACWRPCIVMLTHSQTACQHQQTHNQQKNKTIYSMCSSTINTLSRSLQRHGI